MICFFQLLSLSFEVPYIIDLSSIKNNVKSVQKGRHLALSQRDPCGGCVIYSLYQRQEMPRWGVA